MTTFLKLPLPGGEHVYVNADAIAVFTGTPEWTVMTLRGVTDSGDGSPGEVYPRAVTVFVAPEEIARHLDVQLVRYTPRSTEATQCEP